MQNVPYHSNEGLSYDCVILDVTLSGVEHRHITSVGFSEKPWRVRFATPWKARYARRTGHRVIPSTNVKPKPQTWNDTICDQGHQNAPWMGHTEHASQKVHTLMATPSDFAVGGCCTSKPARHSASKSYSQSIPRPYRIENTWHVGKTLTTSLLLDTHGWRGCWGSGTTGAEVTTCESRKVHLHKITV